MLVEGPVEGRLDAELRVGPLGVEFTRREEGPAHMAEGRQGLPEEEEADGEKKFRGAVVCDCCHCEMRHDTPTHNGKKIT